METIDEGLTINYNMSTHGFEMVFVYDLVQPAKKPSDYSSRVPLTISWRISSSVSIMKMNMVYYEEVLGKPTIRNRM